MPMDTMVDQNVGKGGKDLAFLGYSESPSLTLMRFRLSFVLKLLTLPFVSLAAFRRFNQ